MKVQIKLGSGKSYSFYNIDTNKEYTEIKHGKMPWNILNILNETVGSLKYLGLHELTLTERLLDVQPELTVNEFGESSSLPMLLRDFKKANLVEFIGNTGRNEYKKIKITKLGIKFLKNNTII